MKVVAQGGDVSEYEADDDTGGVPEEAEPAEEANAVDAALQELKDAHADAVSTVQSLSAAIAKVENAAASVHEPADRSGAPPPIGAAGKRLPFCDASSPRFSWANSTFRAQRLPLDFPGLAGKGLAPMGTLEGRSC